NTDYRIFKNQARADSSGSTEIKRSHLGIIWFHEIVITGTLHCTNNPLNFRKVQVLCRSKEEGLLMTNQFESYKTQRDKYVARGVGNGNLHVADHAQGATITDIEGERFIDFAGAIGTLNVGHTHPKITKHLK